MGGWRNGQIKGRGEAGWAVLGERGGPSTFAAKAQTGRGIEGSRRTGNGECVQESGADGRVSGLSGCAGEGKEGQVGELAPTWPRWVRRALRRGRAWKQGRDRLAASTNQTQAGDSGFVH